MLPATPSCCRRRIRALPSCRRDWVCSLAQLQPPFPSKSGLSCYLPPWRSSPAAVSWICPFSCQDRRCLPAAWLGARTRWAQLGTSEPAAALQGLGLPWVGAAPSAAPFSAAELCWGLGWAVGTRSCGLWCWDALKLLSVVVPSRGPPRPCCGFGFSCWDKLELSLWQPLPQDGACFMAKLGRYGWVFFCREGRCH